MAVEQAEPTTAVAQPNFEVAEAADIPLQMKLTKSTEGVVLPQLERGLLETSNEYTIDITELYNSLDARASLIRLGQEFPNRITLLMKDRASDVSGLSDMAGIFKFKFTQPKS